VTDQRENELPVALVCAHRSRAVELPVTIVGMHNIYPQIFLRRHISVAYSFESAGFFCSLAFMICI